jgi:hypothetical protein
MVRRENEFGLFEEYELGNNGVVKLERRGGKYGRYVFS